MNKFIILFCLTLTLSVCAFAQTDGDDYRRNEFYVGYSNEQINDFRRQSLNGFEVAYVRNIHRFFGVKGDFSAAYKTTNQVAVSPGSSPGSTTSVRSETNRSLYNILGGVQLKDNGSKARIKPFAHLLAGLAIERNTIKVLSCSGECSTFQAAPDFTFTNRDLSGVVGGGLDIKVNDKFDFRAIQVDYNPVYQRGRLDNVRISIGFLFK
jgi:hypothetical protein